MPVVRVDLSEAAFERLARLAVRERRPIPMQAEFIIERAVRRVEIARAPERVAAGAKPAKAVSHGVA